MYTSNNGDYEFKGVTSAYLLSLDQVSGLTVNFDESQNYVFRGYLGTDKYCGVYYDTANKKEVLSCIKSEEANCNSYDAFADELSKLLHPCSTVNKADNDITEENMLKLSNDFDQLFNKFKLEDWKNLDEYRRAEFDEMVDDVVGFFQVALKWIIIASILSLLICLACVFLCYKAIF